MTTDNLKEKVNQAKEDFIMDVNTLKYATTLMRSDLSEPGLESAVRRVVTSYENYINSKIEFTNEYFKKDYWENLNENKL
jgi:hypothetical protein